MVSGNGRKNQQIYIKCQSASMLVVLRYHFLSEKTAPETGV